MQKCSSGGTKRVERNKSHHHSCNSTSTSSSSPWPGSPAWGSLYVQSKKLFPSSCCPRVGISPFSSRDLLNSTCPISILFLCPQTRISSASAGILQLLSPLFWQLLCSLSDAAVSFGWLWRVDVLSPFLHIHTFLDYDGTFVYHWMSVFWWVIPFCQERFVLEDVLFLQRKTSVGADGDHEFNPVSAIYYVGYTETILCRYLLLIITINGTF